ncbi:MAG: hypothetical protein PVG65_07055 [Candidatus Thorarchaeota archaeon]|jgi:hypothetical protein
MSFKTKIIGLVLIIIGALPFLLKIEAVNNLISKYAWILPGGIVYQMMIMILGVLLLIEKKGFKFP